MLPDITCGSLENSSVINILCFTQLLSIEQSCFIHMSVFLSSFISSPVRFRFYQKYSDMQWAIDNFYLGPGCLENCRGHGNCLNEQCICDPGYSGPNCYLTQTLKVILLHVLKSEFCHGFRWERRDWSHLKFIFDSCQPEDTQIYFLPFYHFLTKLLLQYPRTGLFLCK